MFFSKINFTSLFCNEDLLSIKTFKFNELVKYIVVHNVKFVKDIEVFTYNSLSNN